MAPENLSMDNSTTVYLNGDYLPLADARVPVLDRGFIFGDGVYEVIPVYAGRLFRLDEHLRRLGNSLAGVRISEPMNNAAWQAMLEELISRQQYQGDAYIYMQITRGVAPRDHACPENVTPTVFAMCNPIAPPDPALLANGIKAITLDDIRWQYCHLKTIALLPNILMKQQAVDQDASEAILVRDGMVTEGTASNVFLVKNDTLFTPPAVKHLLPGITRDLVIELANENSIPFEEVLIPEAWLNEALEIWVTSSTREILPITTLNDQPVGNGRPGPHWQRITGIYERYKQGLRSG
ncbi:MAG: D-amino acid aminotransferase [Gammaproteobacteria bacterium]|nr:MAG: D-amino acid aminotransferase [Gammaproteobacteria bacterium]